VNQVGDLREVRISSQGRSPEAYQFGESRNHRSVQSGLRLGRPSASLASQRGRAPSITKTLWADIAFLRSSRWGKARHLICAELEGVLTWPGRGRLACDTSDETLVIA
jgi:hypothetical protein